MNFRRLLQSPMGMLLILLIIWGPVRTLLTGGPTALAEWLLDIVYALPGIVIGLSLHEFAHAKVAELCGDPTPRYQGRVTIDPRAHIDPAGLIWLLFVGFGWGRPVMVNPNNFKKIRRDSIFVGLAGVATNCIIAFIFTFLCVLLLRSPLNYQPIGQVLWNVLIEVAVINLSLMLFNLLPIPPLDGFGVVCDIFNLRRSGFYAFMQRYSFIVLLILIIFNVPSLVLSPILTKILNGMMTLWAGILF